MKRQSKRKQEKKIENIIAMILAVAVVIIAFLNRIGYINLGSSNSTLNNAPYNINEDSSANDVSGNSIGTNTSKNYNLANIPEYTGNVYVELNNNVPYFTEADYTTNAFENYSELDNFGRCGVAYANVCKEIMPQGNETREAISNVRPSGWQQVRIDGKYLYNRCHLIAYQLTNENANKKNLITGTNYFNVEGMLPFENKVASYIKENPSNHVLYRVTPDFKGDNLVASGVEMEALSVEDNGAGVKFNVYVYNIQPGVTIDYTTGKAKQD